MDGEDDRNIDAIWPLHIEVRLKPDVVTRFDTIRNAANTYITSSYSTLTFPTTLEGWQDNSVLSSSVDRIIACESPCPSTSLPIEQIALQIHVYQYSENDTPEEYSNAGGAEGEEVMAATVCELPSKMWDGLWDSLIFSDDTKSRLLDYIYATVLFSDADVDFNIVTWNRVVLLHGPPGTGKTSLCRALAQKLSIRLSHKYPHSRLLEINSHSLFSRWFSESGKLVQGLFSSVMDLVEDEETFVTVLIDEVESLTAARAGAMAGTEPSDALRVVNALLTQLDKLRYKKNVLVVSTSNLAKAIDTAFVDRADIVQYIDLPPREAVYEILRSCLLELINKGVVAPVDVPPIHQALSYVNTSNSSLNQSTISPRERARQVSVRLLTLAQKCRDQGMSGRSLRRLPVLAHARYIGLSYVPPAKSRAASSSVSESMATSPPTTPSPAPTQRVNGTSKSRGAQIVLTGMAGLGTRVEVWLGAMEKVVENREAEVKRFEK
ncbi:thyroid receptor-interacting protein 13 [Stereum hirsutum FP-91666 SS1]|uniref:thyroid receptor-interacting protein 13 n=1 Tax=Stereum hirsutum (strain FP-91666) TaxID=721885 RepID=UPI000440B426|nr:thyroid receptor-interacting protein 13 [Stereum hirsutum FP-91666 SS1]EIM88236.1 thyroid receptor-interacting protein 13 [Stereum hirsutum FP-91666 SS1]